MNKKPTVNKGFAIVGRNCKVQWYFLCYCKKTMLKQIFIIIISIFTLLSCSSPNDRIYTKFENDLKDSIKINNAEKFEYTDFILHPQKSYFVNAKLKLLILQGSGEMCDSESYYLFDSKSDSILFVVTRTECFESPDRWRKETDTIYVTNFKNATEEKYANGVLVKNTKIENDDYTNDIIFEIKINTENKYNSR